MHVSNVDFMSKINTFDGSDEQLMLFSGGRLNKDNNNHLRKRTQQDDSSFRLCGLVNQVVPNSCSFFTFVQSKLEMYEVKVYLFICILWKLLKFPVHLRMSAIKPVILFKFHVDKLVWFYPLILYRVSKFPVCFVRIIT